MRKYLVLFTAVLSLGVLLAPGTALAKRYNAKTERWRPEVKRQLKAQHIYSARRVDEIMKIIYGESRGNENSVSGSCVGLLQFTGSWKSHYSKAWWNKHHIKGAYKSDGRRSGYWSIYRIVKVYREGGDSYVHHHWKATV